MSFFVVSSQRTRNLQVARGAPRNLSPGNGSGNLFRFRRAPGVPRKFFDFFGGGRFPGCTRRNLCRNTIPFRALPIARKAVGGFSSLWGPLSWRGGALKAVLFPSDSRPRNKSASAFSGGRGRGKKKNGGAAGAANGEGRSGGLGKKKQKPWPTSDSKRGGRKTRRFFRGSAGNRGGGGRETTLGLGVSPVCTGRLWDFSRVGPWGGFFQFSSKDLSFRWCPDWGETVWPKGGLGLGAKWGNFSSRCGRGGGGGPELDYFLRPGFVGFWFFLGRADKFFSGGDARLRVILFWLKGAPSGGPFGSGGGRPARGGRPLSLRQKGPPTENCLGALDRRGETARAFFAGEKGCGPPNVRSSPVSGVR